MQRTTIPDAVLEVDDPSRRHCHAQPGGMEAEDNQMTCYLASTPKHQNPDCNPCRKDIIIRQLPVLQNNVGEAVQKRALNQIHDHYGTSVIIRERRHYQEDRCSRHCFSRRQVPDMLFEMVPGLGS